MSGQARYFEARGETVEGLFAVGEVILNRVSGASYQFGFAASSAKGRAIRLPVHLHLRWQRRAISEQGTLGACWQGC
jgi:hypothetical protein